MFLLSVWGLQSFSHGIINLVMNATFFLSLYAAVVRWSPTCCPTYFSLCCPSSLTSRCLTASLLVFFSGFYKPFQVTLLHE